MEVYYNPPYTNGGIEKSAANLVAFEKTDFIDDICSRTLRLIRNTTNVYFTHPQNEKSFWKLKREMDDFLSTSIIRKYIKMMRFKVIKNKSELKSFILLKFHLYWIVLIIERRRRKTKCV